ncbi:GntR family transcriptional regulator [Micromonospora sp. NPDC006766]|uniref:GntR family transcriptional regulator n=1 Tax=Micromonospora sp. NPDC006766 TaxID=3154778 RepID=UPI003400D0A7
MDDVPPRQPARTPPGRDGRGRMAADEAYARLRDDIVKGRLMPNERLVEVDLAAALGVGRTAVRTVLARLEQEGLVVHEPNRGARVRMVTEAEALEITQARAALEALAARHAALHATPAEVAFMRETLAQMSVSLKAGDLLAYSDGNARLHAKIIEASRHQTAARLIAGLKAQMVRFQYRTVLVPGRSARSFAEHTRIVDAIATADADAAEAAMRYHLSHVADTLREMTSARAPHRTPVPDLVHF